MAVGTEPAESAAPWRDALSRRLALIVMCTFAVGLVPLWVGFSDALTRALFIAFDLSAIGSLAISLHRGVPWRARAWLTVVFILVCGLVGMMRLGILAGPSMLLVTSLVIAALLLGRNALVALVSTVVLITLMAAIAFTNDLLTPAPMDDLSMALPRVWVRTSAITVLGMGSLGYVVLWVVERIEASLARVEAESAERVAAERARAEAEREAAASQKMEVVAQLAAGLGHDFNNHLTVIGLHNGLLRRSNDEAVRVAADGIHTALDQASNVARQLLVVGRREVRAPRVLSLSQLVEAYADTLRRLLPSDVVVRVEATGEPWVLADAGQLHQVLLNLAFNARDAMSSGGHLVVRTRVERLDAVRPAHPQPIPPGEWSVLEVEDDGTGMDEATLARACEPFFTTKEDGRGTGLGLSSVKHIAGQSAGRLELASRPGEGTRAALWLPLVAPAEATSAPLRTEPCSLAGKTVLVAEDNAPALRLMRAELVKVGCTVLAAHDGTEAVALLEGHAGEIDLLCTDAVMPGMPIRELLERWAAKRPGKPVLVCSGHVAEELARRGIEEGRYALLTKPFAPEELVQAVARAIDRA